MGLLDRIFGTKKEDEPKKKADFSNVRAGSSSTAPAAPPAEPAKVTYTVKSGDSLSKIAKHFYGDAGQWRKIYEANRDTIKNPDLIHPGQVFVIPDAQTSEGKND